MVSVTISTIFISFSFCLFVLNNDTYVTRDEFICHYNVVDAKLFVLDPDLTFLRVLDLALLDSH
jgi:hypothetical protein